MEKWGSGQDHYAMVASSFEERASDYDDSLMHRGVAEAVADFVQLRGVSKVLDIATGTGLVLRGLAARDGCLQCFGVDISPAMLEVARRELPQATFIDAAAEELPFADGEFDLVTCVTAMHLMADPRVVLAEAARVLVPAGHLVLATFQLPPGRQPVQRSYRTNHADFETPELIEGLAAPVGFTLTRSAVGQYGGDTCVLTELSL